jgi:hypothetical protein
VSATHARRRAGATPQRGAGAMWRHAEYSPGWRAPPRRINVRGLANLQQCPQSNLTCPNAAGQ